MCRTEYIHILSIEKRRDFLFISALFAKFAVKLHKIRPNFTNPLTSQKECCIMQSVGEDSLNSKPKFRISEPFRIFIKMLCSFICSNIYIMRDLSMNEGGVDSPNSTGCYHSRALGMCFEENKLLKCFRIP